MAVILLSAGAVILLVDVALTQLPHQQWWPSWSAIGDWLGQWWPLLLAMALAATAIALVRRGAPRAATAPTSVASVRWESGPGDLGLLPRTTATTSVPAAPERRWNWSAITSVVTAATALAALGFTAQSLSATREQINLSEQGQITDRYTKAIDQLGTQGADHLQTRLGGIYALERLAHDSPRDQPTIVEILSAFIRSSLPTATKQPDGTTTCPNTTDLQVDVRAALSVLGRRDHDNDNGTVTDLHGVCLVGAVLADAYLVGANLFLTNLTNAYLVGANLTGADLSGADLTHADLTHAVLTNAHLNSANLSGAEIARATFTGANLIHANLTQAYLHGANLAHANLTQANLTRTELTHTSLTGADLTGANLTHAYLDIADLTGATFTGANLTNAQLGGADLTGARLDGADLTGAVHSGTITQGATKKYALGAWW